MVNWNIWIQKIENNPVMNEDIFLYHFIRVACNCRKFDINERYLPQIFEEDFEEEYPDMVCEIFTELTIAYYQGYGY